MNIPGIHHVTALAGDPQRNLDFYTGVLGLHLVKLTVNFDDPGTYHLYYADAAGTPGTILTFFPWPGAPKGRQGTGQTTSVAFRVPVDSMAYWAERLQAESMDGRIAFEDPDGLPLELVAGGEGEGTAISGFHGVTLSESGYESTAQLLTNTFGYRLVGREGNRFRYAAADGGAASHIDVLCQPDARSGAMGVGTVHHVAFRAETDDIQREWQAKLTRERHNVTPILDRQYFHSIYFREPGGVLFEIATDPPGFATDEKPDRLGTHLKLPPWLEKDRTEIERILPPLRLPR
ncbi:MAG: mhqO [Bryobacterales bacterium]|nr:mhqO [Bryobacterales bacterium]